MPHLRSLTYYKAKGDIVDSNIENAVIKAFKDIRNNYGMQTLKVVLKRQVILISRRRIGRIGRIIKKYGLVSNYTFKRFKNRKTKCIGLPIPNIVDGKFNERQPLEVVISDLTYVNVAEK